MLKLHGFPVSNYANMVHFALLEKGIPFEYVLAFPDQGPDTLVHRGDAGAIAGGRLRIHERGQPQAGRPCRDDPTGAGVYVIHLSRK